MCISAFPSSYTGTESATVAEQLSFCNQQMTQFVFKMGQAIKTVKSLTLLVQHKRRGRPTQSASPIVTGPDQPEQKEQPQQDVQQQQQELVAVEGHESDDKDGSAVKFDDEAEAEDESEDQDASDEEGWDDERPLKITCPRELGVVSASVFGMLASALPSLQRLCLRGCCWDASVPSFGVSCPLLNKLAVDVPYVSVEALHDFGKHLPHLVSVTVGSTEVNSCDNEKLTTYIETLLPALQHCSKLTSLTIQFRDVNELTCQSELWAHVPIGLKHLTADFEIEFDGSFKELINRVPSLHLLDCPVGDLCELSKEFPILEMLCVSDPQHVRLGCGDGTDAQGNRDGRAKLIKRLGSGRLVLHCNNFEFMGTSQEIQAVIESFPPMPHIKEFIFTCTGDSPPSFLTAFSHKFPHAWGVNLLGAESQGGCWDMAVLEPLASMRDLLGLGLYSPQLVITMDGLRMLGRRGRKLFQLRLAPALCEGMDHSEIYAAVQRGESTSTVYVAIVDLL